MGVSFGSIAKQDVNSSFQFKLLSSESENIKLTVIDSKATNVKKGMALFHNGSIKPSGEIIINIDSNDKKLSSNELYKITGYKLKQFSTSNKNVEQLFELVDRYTAFLEKKYPHRFVTKKRSCMNRLDDFFQCLYDEKESWNTLFFVNNGEISLSLLPVLDDKINKVIGGSVSITYTIGTGKLLDRAA